MGSVSEYPLFTKLLKFNGIPQPEPEYRFHSTRKWRFDFAWTQTKVALEVEGGAFTRGRHTRGAGFVKDMEKYSEAAALGWRILRVTPSALCTPETLGLIRRALEYKEAAA